MRRGVMIGSVIGAVVVAVVIGAIVALGGRTGSGPQDAAPAAPPSYDPPHRFDPALATDLPREADGDPPPVALDGFTAFVALPGGLQVIDTRTGAVRAEPAPQGTPSGVAPRAPVVARLGDRDVAVAAYAVAVPGHGTTVGHDAVELLVVDRATLAPLPGARVDLPPTLEDTARLRSASVVAVTGDVATVVTEAGPDREPTTHAVDLRGGTVRWRVPGFAASYAENGLLVGVRRDPEGSQAAAVTAAGEPAWAVGGAGENVSVARGGRAAVAVVSVGVGSGARTLTFYDTATGRALVRRPVPGGLICRFDEQLTTVCSNSDAAEPWAAGFDAATGRTLWELPDAAAGRVAPRVTAVWHGAVYGTTENGPVVLKAPTGQDWTGPSPNVAPDLVNDVIGIVGATMDRPRPRAYRAVG